MKRLAAVTACAFSIALSTGCASPTDAPERPEATSQELVSAPNAAAGVGQFPPRANVPFGASRADVCKADDGDVKKVFADYVASKGATIIRPSADVSTWHWNGWSYECRYCDLSNMELYVGLDKVSIYESYAPNLMVDSTGVSLDLESVYARGARLLDHITLSAYSVDLRCADIELDWPDRGDRIVQGQSVDFSGTTGGLNLYGYFSDARFTGSEATITLDGHSSALGDARLDGIRGTVTMHDGYLGGTVRLDGSKVDIDATNMTFSSTGFVFGGAQGTLRLHGTTSFEGADLTDAHPGYRVDLGTASVRAINGTRWPVGKNAIAGDDAAALPKIDFAKSGQAKAGGVLVAQQGETWPAGALDLTGLRLSHGAFPPGADLSRTILDKAALEGVSLASATLSTAGRHTSFKGAHLARADLTQKNIDGIDFTGADLRGAKLADTTGKATFDQARAGVLGPHVDDNDTDLPIKTSFQRAALSTSTFRQTYLEYADFGFAGLADVDFTGAHLDWARFTGAVLQRSGVGNTSLKSAASVLATTWDGADLRGVDLTGLDFRSAEGKASSFERAFLCGAKLTNTKLHDTNLGGMFFDVIGGVRFPDGTVGPCTPGDRTGALTASLDSRIGTQCPNGGQAPLGQDGQCTAAQWKVEGIPTDQCTDDEKRHPLDDGGACTKDCQCQSAFCAPDHTCKEP